MLGQPVDDRKLLACANLVERHVKRHLGVIPALVDARKQHLRGGRVEMPVALAAKDDTRGAGVERHVDVVSHHGELVCRVGEVSPARPHHDHDVDAMLLAIGARGTHDARAGARAALRKVVAQLDASRTRRDRRRSVLHILGAELPHKAHGPSLKEKGQARVASLPQTVRYRQRSRLVEVVHVNAGHRQLRGLRKLRGVGVIGGRRSSCGRGGLGGSGGAGRKVRGELAGEGVVRVVHEVLEQGLVLVAELLAGLLETIHLVELALLLGQGLRR